MKLHYSPTSPYVRKVMVLVHETGLLDRVERVDSAVSPVAPDESVIARNPLGKVPTLITDDGEALFDSRVICEYLDSLHDGRRMFPAPGPARWRALAAQALGDGILDAAVNARYERDLRPERLRWDEWVEGQMGKVRRALDRLEAEAGGGALSGSADIGTIAIGCALGYLDFRYAGEAWRDARPRLAAWYAGFAERPSMRATAPAERPA